MPKACVFIIEDDPVFSKTLSGYLAMHGYHNVTQFAEGEQCLDHLAMPQNPRPDVVFLDFSLKGLNGLDVLYQIKAKSKKSKVVIITAIDDATLKARCLRQEATLFFHKHEVVGGLPMAVLKVLKAKRFWFF